MSEKDPKDISAFESIIRTEVIRDGMRIIHHHAATTAERTLAINAILQVAFSAGMVRGVEKLRDAMRTA